MFRRLIFVSFTFNLLLDDSGAFKLLIAPQPDETTAGHIVFSRETVGFLPETIGFLRETNGLSPETIGLSLETLDYRPKQLDYRLKQLVLT